jgi:hypothetical protein
MYMNKSSVSISKVGVNYSVFVDGQMVYTFASEEGAYQYVAAFRSE